jgi:N-acetylglutamate synthase-like GNAT family acetyltransferase
MFHVKEMSPEDLKFAVRITDTMGWNLIEEDFKFFMQLEPDGCFVLLSDSERIGLATTVNFGEIGWIGNVIVDQNQRKQGAGSLLVEHCANYLRSKRVETVSLYAYIDRIHFYERLGFQYDSEFTVLKGKGFSSLVKASLKEAAKKDAQKIIDYDCSCFGASRGKLLEPILFDPDNLCYISIEDRRISGYAAAKVYGQTAEIGPLVCPLGRNDLAIDLLKAILHRLSGLEVSMCLPKKEHAIFNMLTDAGFKENFLVARMFSGRPLVENCIYVAESLERG